MEALCVSAQVFEEITKHVRDKEVIKAVKALRSGVPDCRLKDLKAAIDRKMGRRSDGPLIRMITTIKSLTINVGEGDIELDLEELQLKALSNIKELGIVEIRRILDLQEILAAWDEGKKITIQDDEPVECEDSDN
jgi:hypothetical protein